MISIRMAAGALALCSALVMADWVGEGAGAPLTTVAAATRAADDAMVRLEGHLVRKLDREHYEFRDHSGSIRVEIDAEDMPAQDIGPATRVRLTGEVDRGLFGTEIDVDRIEILH